MTNEVGGWLGDQIAGTWLGRGWRVEGGSWRSDWSREVEWRGSEGCPVMRRGGRPGMRRSGWLGDEIAGTWDVDGAAGGAATGQVGRVAR